MIRKILNHPIKLGLILALSSSMLFAEQADRSQPVTVDADKASFKESNQETEFEGNVIIKQGSLHIWADFVQLERQKVDNQKIIATGKPVKFEQNLDKKKPNGQAERIKGQANKITFSEKAHLLVLEGHAKVDREGDLVQGQTITYNTQTETYTASSGQAKGQKNRVSVVLQPATVQGNNKK